MGWLVAIHIGAGRYGDSADAETKYTALLHAALEHGRQLMEENVENPTVTRAVCVASGVLSILERSALTNCGRGSNLTADGVVECEASVVCGRTKAVAACAAVRGVVEPSSLSRRLLERSLCPRRYDAGEIGREPPVVLVGDGARRFANEMGLETAGGSLGSEQVREYQVTEQARRQWSQWHERISGAAKAEEDERLDTVGAICVDPEGNVAAALSSGGVLYKVPGRVGLAGCPRVGCDARNPRNSFLSEGSKKRRRRQQENGYAVACTGRGEQFIRSAFTSTLAGKLRQPSAEIDESLRTAFDGAMEDCGGVPLEGGAIALVVSPSDRPPNRRSTRQRRANSNGSSPKDDAGSDAAEAKQTIQLGVAFTTPCMGVGYLHDKSTPHVQILRQPRKHEQHLVVHVSHFAA